MGGWDIHQESSPKRGSPSQLFTKILAMGGWDIHQESFVLKGLVPLVNKNAPFFFANFPTLVGQTLGPARCHPGACPNHVQRRGPGILSQVAGVPSGGRGEKMGEGDGEGRRGKEERGEKAAPREARRST